MAYKPWTPRIVAGTDMDGMQPVPSNITPFGDVPVDDVIITTHSELEEYAKSIGSIPKGAKGYIDQDDINWNYGPIQRRDGDRGQFVVELHNNKEHQVYWVNC